MSTSQAPRNRPATAAVAAADANASNTTPLDRLPTNAEVFCLGSRRARYWAKKTQCRFLGRILSSLFGLIGRLVAGPLVVFFALFYAPILDYDLTRLDRDGLLVSGTIYELEHQRQQTQDDEGLDEEEGHERERFTGTCAMYTYTAKNVPYLSNFHKVDDDAAVGDTLQIKYLASDPRKSMPLDNITAEKLNISLGERCLLVLFGLLLTALNAAVIQAFASMVHTNIGYVKSLEAVVVLGALIGIVVALMLWFDDDSRSKRL